ncbi:hypothetical protein DVH24_002411 [Malus domestica]|uniref:Uncharacterized protein n=1 Tax=Malus domestica TaxID=3750 RepID=A0A498IHR2_MALDO|nr:hypothetical protein DVH24_002411 [Malus domestica]
MEEEAVVTCRHKKGEMREVVVVEILEVEMIVMEEVVICSSKIVFLEDNVAVRMTCRNKVVGMKMQVLVEMKKHKACHN